MRVELLSEMNEIFPQTIISIIAKCYRQSITIVTSSLSFLNGLVGGWVGVGEI